MSHQPTSNLVNVDGANANQLRDKLEREIKGLERKLEQLRLGEGRIDYSLEQTYREMIHERREMLLSMPGQQLL